MKKLKQQLPIILLMSVLYSLTVMAVYFAFTREHTPLEGLSNVRLAIFCILLPLLVKYFTQLIVAPLYGLVEKFRQDDSVAFSPPKVSVLIPAWNEEVGIIKTIKSVLDTYYEDLELIVINDGSTDSTHELVTQFLAKFKMSRFNKPSIKYLSLTNGGKALALNKALKVATGEIIMTIDADSVMDRHTVSNIVKHFQDEKVGAVAGNVIVGNRKKPIEFLQQLEYLYGFFFKRADSVFNSVYIIGGAAAAYRKSVLDVVGGFDHEIITEDIEMSTRILAEGYKTRFAADAIVYTEGPSDWSSLCSQRLRWKFGRIMTFIKHRKAFFSSDKKHNPYLTFLLLPLAAYSELTLLLEGPLLAIFYGYTIVANDYFPLAFVIVFMTCLITLQILTDPKARHHLNILPLAPVAWIVFYIIDVVEFQALCRSLRKLFKRENLKWQKWSRVGLLGDSVA